MHSQPDFLDRIALGAAGDFAGTLVLQALMAAGQKWRPDTLPPLRQDPGESMDWRDLVLFYEYFHGDDGRGLGASQQTGWTALIARHLEDIARKRREGTGRRPAPAGRRT